MSQEFKTSINGIEYRRAICCNPLPGDPIFGFVSRSHELAIHRNTCVNARDLHRHADRIIKVSWPPEISNKTNKLVSQATIIPICIQCNDRPGVLKAIISAISDEETNIRTIEARTSTNHADVLISVDILSRKQITSLRRRLSRTQGVIAVTPRGEGDEFKEEIFSDTTQTADEAPIRPLIEQVNRCLVQLANEKPGLLRDLNPRLFEEFVAELFDGLGYAVELTAQTRDGGRDIVAIRKQDNILLKFLIECKFFLPPNSVGVGHVRQLLGVKYDEGASKAILATTSFFTAPAREIEGRHIYELELKDYYGILDWVKEYNKSLKKVDGLKGLWTTKVL